MSGGGWLFDFAAPQVLVANIAVFGHELRVGAITWASFEKFFLLFSVVWYVLGGGHTP